MDLSRLFEEISKHDPKFSPIWINECIKSHWRKMSIYADLLRILGIDPSLGNFPSEFWILLAEKKIISFDRLLLHFYGIGSPLIRQFLVSHDSSTFSFLNQRRDLKNEPTFEQMIFDDDIDSLNMLMSMPSSEQNSLYQRGLQHLNCSCKNGSILCFRFFFLNIPISEYSTLLPNCFIGQNEEIISIIMEKSEIPNFCKCFESSLSVHNHEHIEWLMDKMNSCEVSLLAYKAMLNTENYNIYYRFEKRGIFHREHLFSTDIKFLTVTWLEFMHFKKYGIISSKRIPFRSNDFYVLSRYFEYG